jgi:hypothetical protein
MQLFSHRVKERNNFLWRSFEGFYFNTSNEPKTNLVLFSKVTAGNTVIRFPTLQPIHPPAFPSRKDLLAETGALWPRKESGDRPVAEAQQSRALKSRLALADAAGFNGAKILLTPSSLVLDK